MLVGVVLFAFLSYGSAAVAGTCIKSKDARGFMFSTAVFVVVFSIAMMMLRTMTC